MISIDNMKINCLVSVLYADIVYSVVFNVYLVNVLQLGKIRIQYTVKLAVSANSMSCIKWHYFVRSFSNSVWRMVERIREALKIASCPC